MPDNLDKPSRFWQELKRRRVIRVVAMYAAAAFVILELVSIIVEPLMLPAWTLTLAIVLLCIGFVIAIVLSWIYDITPEGVQKTDPDTSDQPEAKEKPGQLWLWKVATYISVGVIAGLIIFNIVKSRSSDGNVINDETSIAVLPFSYYNMNAETEDIGDAFANEMITQLYKVKGFDRVISHTSTLKYKGPDKLSIPEIGRELDANYIIEGSVERQNEDVSIQIQIIHASSDDHIWADEFKGEWEDIFSIRADIATRVAAVLKTMLSQEEIEKIEKKPTPSLEAYDLYLLGSQYRSSGREPDLLRALELYNAAIEIDPGFALAYASVSRVYIYLFWNANWPPQEAYANARIAALKALKIDPGLAEAHLALANVLLNNDWNFEEAEKEFLKAIELNPGLPDAYNDYADLLNIQCRYQECHQRAMQAMKLDPNSNNTHDFYGLTYYLIGETDSAINYLKHRIDMKQISSSSHYFLGYIYIEIGEFSNAISELERAVALFSGLEAYHLYLGIAYARSGRIEKTRGQLELLNRYEEEGKVVSFGKAVLLAELGETDQALYWLEKACQERYQFVLYLKTVKVMFEPIKSDPRYIEILNRVFPDG